MKAVILAAGFGTRLRPLTGERAKPAMWFVNKPVIAHCLEMVQMAGIGEVLINLHYKGFSIRRALRKVGCEGMRIAFFHEPKILGTAGALAPMRKSLDKDTFVMVNGDVLIHIDLRKVIAFHREHGFDATLVLWKSDESEFPLLGADVHGTLTRFPYGEFSSGIYDWRGVFTGIQILEPTVFRFIRNKGFQGITSEVYPRMLVSGYRIGAFCHTGYWNDIGTPGRFLEAHRDVLSGAFPLAKHLGDSEFLQGESNLIHSSAQIGEHVHVGDNVVICENAKIGDYCTLRDVVMLPDSIMHDHMTRKHGIGYSDNEFISVVESVNPTVQERPV